MRKILFVLTFLITFCGSIAALDASITYTTFHSSQTNYVEVNLFILGETVTYLPKELDTLMMQAGVEVVILFKQNEQIIKYDKYNLNSPINATSDNFVDLKRYGLSNVSYVIEVSIEDLNDASNVTKYSGKIEINYEGTALLQSDVQLLSTAEPATDENVFVKNGHYQEALPYNFYNKNASKLIFYNEIYNAEEATPGSFIVSYGINRIVNERSRIVSIGHKRKRSAPVNVLLIEMDISEIESGNYELFVEIRNKEKELQSKKTINFQRSNPYFKFTRKESMYVDLNTQFVGKLSFEELEYSVRAIAPLVKDSDVEFMNVILSKRKPDTTAMQRFLFNFWVNQEPNQPEILYTQYMEVAKAVDRMFDGGFGHGFESDRGFIFMKYGLLSI